MPPAPIPRRRLPARRMETPLSTEKAHTLKEAQNRFDPERPLESVEELEAFFVERQQSPIARMRLLLEDSERPQKILFTGHRGSGKSTELAKLADDLREEFLTISFSIKERVLSINDVEPADVMLSLGLALTEYATEERINLDANTYRHVLNFTREIIEEVEQEAAVQQSAEVESDVGLRSRLGSLVGRFQQRLTTEETTRRKVRQKLKVRLTDLSRNIEILAREIEVYDGRPPLLVLMDLDKTSLDVARRLFHDNSQPLRMPEVNVIYTFPIALRRASLFGQVKMNFPQVERLPNISTYHRDGRDHAAGRTALRRILTCRADDALFADGVLDDLARLSGGIPRELIKLARLACLEARIRGAGACIERQDVARAASREREEFEVRLDGTQRQRLAKVHRTHAIDDNDDDHRELLQSLSLLEYRDPDEIAGPSVWYDVHPLALPLIEGLPTDGDTADGDPPDGALPDGALPDGDDA
jgi:hypothetical protein